jgi:DNA-binding CsgD family transcriptional regulator
VVDALEPEDSAVILLGDDGVGKLSVATEAAAALGQRLQEEIDVVTIPVTADNVIDILRAVEQDAAKQRSVLVVEGIDTYSAAVAAEVDRLVGVAGLRIVATARRVSAGATRLAGHRGVRRIPVAPLSLMEAERCVCCLLGCDAVEPLTLRRWYRLTRGFFSSLTVLALATDEEGLLGRERGCVWDVSDRGHVSAELVEDLQARCTPQELATLQLINEAAPIEEEPLLRLIDSGHLATLIDHGILTVVILGDGKRQVSLKQPLYAGLVRALTPEPRRREINAMLYDAIAEDVGPKDPTAAGASLVRLVGFGMASGRDVPLSWLGAAFDRLTRSGGDTESLVGIASMIAAHRDVNATLLAKVAIYLGTWARLSGEQDVAATAYGWGLRAREALRPGIGGPDSLSTALEIRLATYEAVDQGDLAKAGQRLSELEGSTRGADDKIKTLVRGARMASTVAAGRLNPADIDDVGAVGISSLPGERARFWSTIASTLVLIQRGKFAEAADRAEAAVTIVGLGGAGYETNVEMLLFSIFLTHWFSGALELAHEAFLRLGLHALHGDSQTGLVDLAEVMLANSLGRWREAERKSHLLVLRMSKHDPYVVMPLAQAAYALALAGLGERSASARVIRLAESERFGLALMAKGLVLTQTLRARMWNQCSETAEAARVAANWAAADHLPMVELVATHVRGLADPSVLPPLLARTSALAARVEAKVAEVLVQHCHEIATQKPAWETPAARLLADSGAWMPLPQGPHLSAREREVAMLASLGYSSKWIAAHHHLSARTVETHLRHVFTKTSTTNRDELRTWFRREPVHRSNT